MELTQCFYLWPIPQLLHLVLVDIHYLSKMPFKKLIAWGLDGKEGDISHSDG